MRLADARWAEEDERANGFVRILEARPVALDGLHHLLDGVVLSDDFALQVLVHASELSAFLLSNSLNRNACHHCHDVSYVVFRHRDSVVLGIFFPRLLGGFKSFVQGPFLVTKACSLFVTLRTDNLALFLFDALDFLFDVHDFLGHVDVGQVHAATHLIQGVNRFVGKVAVGDVTAREGHAGTDGFFRVGHAVMLFVLVLDVVQDLHGFFDRGRLHHDLLEPTFQRAVLFNVLTVFVEGGGSNALDFATSEGGLEHVGRIERATCAASSHDRVDFVNEEDDVGGFLQSVHHGLHSLFELPTVFRPGNERSDVEGDDALVEQHPADLLFDDSQRQSFRDGAFADPRFAHQDGVVLFATRQHLADTLNFLGSAYDWIQTTFFGQLGQIAPEIVQHWGLGLGVALPARGTAGAATVVAASAFCGGFVV